MKNIIITIIFILILIVEMGCASWFKSRETLITEACLENDELNVTIYEKTRESFKFECKNKPKGGK